MKKKYEERLISFQSLNNLQDSIEIKETLFVGNYQSGFRLYLTINNVKYVLSTTGIKPDRKIFFNLDRAVKRILVKTKIKEFVIQIED